MGATTPGNQKPAIATIIALAHSKHTRKEARFDNPPRAKAEYGTAQELTDSLTEADKSEYVRVVASWINDATNWTDKPTPSGDRLVDTLVAAACGHKAVAAGQPEPDWVQQVPPLDSFWHPGIPGMFAWSFVHSPACFKNKGIIIERDSLVCV